MRIIYASIMILMCCAMASAVSFEKASDTQVKMVEQVTNETTYTIGQIDHEIEGIDYDIAQYQSKIDECNVRKAKFEEMKKQAADLGVKTPVELEAISEPISEPTTDDVI